MINGISTERQEKEGGWGWVVVGSGFVYSFFCLGIFKALGVFVVRFEEQLCLDAGVVGSIIGLSGGLKFVMGPLASKLTFVASVRFLAISGGFLTGVGFISATYSSSAISLALSMSILSIGLGIPLIAYMQIIRQYFDQKYALTSGIAFAGGALGMMVLPPLSDFFIETYGTQMALLLLGALAFNLCVGGMLLKPPDGKEASRGNYELLDDRQDTESSWFGISLMRRRPILIAYNTAFILWNVALSGWVIFLVSYTMSLNYPASTASFMSTLGGAGTLIGRIVMFALPDRDMKSSKLQFQILCVGGTVTLCLYPFVNGLWLLGVLSFLAGVFLGAPASVAVVMVKYAVPGDQTEFVEANGLMMLSMGIGTLTGGPLTGALFVVTGSFSVAFFSLAAMEVLATVLSLAKSSE